MKQVRVRRTLEMQGTEEWIAETLRKRSVTSNSTTGTDREHNTFWMQETSLEYLPPSLPQEREKLTLLQRLWIAASWVLKGDK